MRAKSERRQYPRIDHQLPMKLAVNGYDFVTYTRNISCVGAYCHIDKYMPPFTKVVVRFELPIATENGNKNTQVACKGVVVRSEDGEKGGFNIAIFFNDINDSQRKHISQYISQLLPADSGDYKLN